MADLETLLAPVVGDNPAGESLSYDAQRQAVDHVFETSASGEPLGGEDVDWRSILRAIEELSARTKDIWLPIYMIRAGAKSGDLETVERGSLYLAGLCETLWDTMYPSLDDLGFQGRRGPCESLTSIGGFLSPLRHLVLIEHPRHGRFTGKDVERFAAEGEGADGYGAFRAALDDLPSEAVAEKISRLGAIRDAIGRVEAVLSQNEQGEGGVDFSATYVVLDSLRRSLASFAAVGEKSQSDNADATTSPAETIEATGTVKGRIETRDDAIRAIESAIDYFRRREPASPVPVALNRAKAWVAMDFLSILEDIAPDSIGDARRVLTSQRNEPG